MQTGKFLAQLNWNEVSREQLVTLRRKFPVTCSIIYADSPTTPTIKFTRYLYYSHLNHQGFITVDCNSSPLRIRRIFRKFIASQTDNPNEINGRLSNHRNTTIATIPPIWSIESGKRCIIPGAIYSSDSSKITVNVPQLSSHYAQMICPHYKHNVAYVNFNAELVPKVTPDQKFYVFDQLDHVHIACSTGDEGVPIYGISCLVGLPNGKYIGPKTSNAGFLTEIIDSSIPKKSAEYLLKCRCPEAEEPSEMYITIMEEEDVKLFIRGLEKKIHFYPDRHTYICVLEGPLVGEFQEDVHNGMNWTCTVGDREAVVRIEENIIFIGNDTELASIYCTCTYSRYGLELSRSMEILVVNREQVKLACKPVSDSDDSTYVLRCYVTAVGSLAVHKPVCRIIYGYTRFETFDRSDYTEGKIDLIVYREIPGLYTFQCIAQVDTLCLSSVALFPVLSNQTEILIQPPDLLAPVGSMTKCRADGLGTIYDTRLELITSGLDHIFPVERCIRWLGQQPPIPFYPVMLICKTSSMYMGEIILSSEKSVFKVVYHRFVLRLEPLKQMYKAGEKISCSTSTNYPMSGRLKPLLNIRGLLNRDSFTRNEVGVFYYKCIQYVEKKTPKVQEGWLISEVTTGTAEIYDYYVDGEHVGWICFPSAEPKRHASYELTFENTETSASIVEDNKIFLTVYNVAATLVIKCKATMDGRTYEGLVITNVRGYWLTEQQLKHHLQTNRAIVFLILTANVMMLLLIIHIWVWFSAREPTIDRNVHMDVGFLRSNYMYIGSELVGRNNLFYAAEMIQSYNELQMLVSRIRLLKADVAGNELLSRDSESESISQSSESVEGQMEAGRTSRVISSNLKRDSQRRSRRKSFAMNAPSGRQSMAITTELPNPRQSILTKDSDAVPEGEELDSEESNEELNVSHLYRVRSRRLRSRRRRSRVHKRRPQRRLR